MGTALDVCELKSNVTTLFSLQLEQIETKALLTYSEINELASNVFFRSLANITSN